MTASETCHYRGYDIVPTRLWSEWCVGIYRTRSDLPLMQSSLSTQLDVRYWHIADIDADDEHVRFQG